MNIGTNILGLAMLDRATSDARQAKESSLYYAREAGAAEGKLRAWKRTARSHVHLLRAFSAAHKMTEDQLIAALKAENANHPLASREAVDAAVDQANFQTIIDPEIIKRTYPDGKLPEGTYTPDGGGLSINDLPD